MKALGIAAAFCTALYGLYLFAYPSVTIRYRLALTVVADGAEHTGSGVVEVTYGKGVAFMTNSGGGYYVAVKGEAVAVDVPNRGTLFALLKAGPSHRSSPEEIIPKAFGVSWAEDRFTRLRALTGRVELSPADLPLLVRFRDINEPNTVEGVDPSNLAEAFGPGVYLKQAWVEITSDPVTTGIEKRLPWLHALRERRARLDGDNKIGVSGKELVNRLGPGSFQTGGR